MSYTLHIEPRSSYLHIRVTGENSAETISNYITDALTRCLQYDHPDVLIEENLSGPSIDTLAIYNIVSANIEKLTQAVGRIAYVDINPGHDINAREFAEDVAVNRGVFFQVFSTVQAAREWLEKPGVKQ